MWSPLIILSKAYSSLGKVNEALVFATRAKEMEPNSAPVQIQYARALGDMQGVDTGVHYFTKLINNYPLVLQYRHGLAEYLFEDEQYEESATVLQELITLEPASPEAYFYKGRIFMYQKDYEGAYQAFLQAAVFNPTDPKPLFYIGLLYLETKKYALAKKIL